MSRIVAFTFYSLTEWIDAIALQNSAALMVREWGYQSIGQKRIHFKGLDTGNQMRGPNFRKIILFKHTKTIFISKKTVPHILFRLAVS